MCTLQKFCVVSTCVSGSTEASMNNCSCFCCQFQRNGFEHCCHSARECTVCSYIPAMGVFAYAQLHSQTLQQLHSLCTCVCTLQLFFVFGSQTQGIAHCSCASVSYEHYAPVREHVAEFHVLLNACTSVPQVNRRCLPELWCRRLCSVCSCPCTSCMNICSFELFIVHLLFLVLRLAHWTKTFVVHKFLCTPVFVLFGKCLFFLVFHQTYGFKTDLQP